MLLHFAEEYTGERWSLTFFLHGKFGEATAEIKTELSALGFQLPSDATSEVRHQARSKPDEVTLLEISSCFPVGGAALALVLKFFNHYGSVQDPAVAKRWSAIFRMR